MDLENSHLTSYGLHAVVTNILFLVDCVRGGQMADRQKTDGQMTNLDGQMADRQMTDGEKTDGQMETKK